jgi:hypothetical protein
MEKDGGRSMRAVKGSLGDSLHIHPFHPAASENEKNGNG